MIDTIVLRIHDLHKNADLIKALNWNASKETTILETDVPTKELKNLNTLSDLPPTTRIEIKYLENSKDIFIKAKRGKINIPSSHYTLSYSVNHTLDYIEINFSIPKFHYGTNILLFTEHAWDAKFRHYSANELQHNFEIAYDWLRRFIITFFKTYAFYNVDLTYVELNRIDVCYNQVFRSKEDALEYLHYQKKQKKKYSRDESKITEFETSLMFVTKMYSAKIYHKGSEFAKNDKKELENINRQKGYEYFKITELQNFADKILRYELTIRNAYLNYLFMNSLFRTNCSLHKAALKLIEKVDTYIQYNSLVRETAFKLYGETKTAFDYIKKNSTTVTQDDKKIAKQYSQTLNKRRNFILEQTPEMFIFSTKLVNYDSYTLHFSRELLMLCFKKLEEFINEFQVVELDTEDNVKKKFENYNLYNKKNINVNKMLEFYNDLEKYGSFEELRKNKHISRATFYRYIERFKIIGITTKQIVINEDGGYLPKAYTDLKEYQDEITKYFRNLATPLTKYTYKVTF